MVGAVLVGVARFSVFVRTGWDMFVNVARGLNGKVQLRRFELGLTVSILAFLDYENG